VIVLAITQASMRRLLRDRVALFLLLVLPIVIIVVAAEAVRGFSTFRVGVVEQGPDAASAQIVTALRQSGEFRVTLLGSVADLRKAIARGQEDTGIVLPPGMAAAERRGASIDLPVLAEQANGNQQAAATGVTSVIEHVGARVEAAVFAAAHSPGSYDANLVLASRLEPHVTEVGIRTTVADRSQNTLPGGFSYSAPTELVLFVFISALMTGSSMIESRRLGMFERISAAPVSSRDILLGETLTFLAIALTQSLAIVVIGATAFGVSWGNPLAAGALVIAWSLVAASAGMLSGTVFRTPERAASMGPVIGIALAMLGGCMWPLSIVSSLMRQLGHVAPHAWAVDGWTSVLARHGGLAAISGDLAILCGYAAVVFAFATVRFRRSLAP
jgi:ABC-2 type transport system permease protein